MTLAVPAPFVPLARRVHAIPVLLRDGLLAVLLALAGAISAQVFPGVNQRGGLGMSPLVTLQVMSVLGALPVAVRRIYPGVSFLLALIVVVAMYAMGLLFGATVMLALFITLYSAVAYGHPRGAPVWAVLGIGLGFATAIYTWKQSGFDIEAGLFNVLATALPVALGFSLRQSRARARLAFDHARAQIALGEASAANAASAERMRITSEIHDIVAHHITGIVLQARAASQRLASDPARAQKAVDAVVSEGTQALSQLRELVNTLRPSESADRAPQPTLDDLPALIERARRVGGDIHLEVVGEPRPTRPAVGLALYRVAQEALTNVLRHAAPARAQVTVTYLENEIDLQVDDEGRPSPPATLDPDIVGTGHGLVGMRERIETRDGIFSAGPRPEGGWSVRARVPSPPDTLVP